MHVDRDTDDPLHQRCRCVVGAGAVPLVRIHESLEHATKHVGRHHTAVTFARGEVEGLEEGVKRIAPRWRRDVDLPAPFKEREARTGRR